MSLIELKFFLSKSQHQLITFTLKNKLLHVLILSLLSSYVVIHINSTYSLSGSIVLLSYIIFLQ